MTGQIIISISREFGSEGREIAEQLAKELGLKLYDRNILEEITREKSLPHDLKEYEEKPTNVFLTRRINEHSSSMEENLAQMQFDFIRKKADDGESFVVVGRCADVVLRGREDLVTIFIFGDRKYKIKHVMERYHITEEEAIAKIRRHDYYRRSYHNRHAKTKWGHAHNYDLCLNSSKLGIDNSVELLVDYVKRMKGI